MVKPVNIESLAKSGVVVYLPDLKSRDKNYLIQQLTLTQRKYKGSDETVKCYVKDGDWLWMPRYFDHDLYLKSEQRDVTGLDETFDLKVTLDPKRGQPEAVDKMYAHLSDYKAGILKAFTGCGKTILGYAVAARFKKSIGVLVYAEHMIDNWVEHAELCFGIKPEDIGIVKEGRCDLGKAITIMTVQTLYSGREFPPELFEQFGVIVADEVHRYGAPVWQTILQRFPARYRLGMSADESRQDGLGSIISWNFGAVGHTINKTENIAKPKVILVEYETTYKRGSYAAWPSQKPELTKYRMVVSKDHGRNVMIGKLLVDARKKGRKAIVFSHYRKHLLQLKEVFDKEMEKAKIETKSALFISKSKQKGEPKDMRKRIATLEEALGADFIFSTYSMASTAFNAPHLDTGFAVTPLAKPLQPIGRLRDKGPEGRKSLMWVDITESGVQYASEQADRRIWAYEDLGCEVTQVKKNNVISKSRKSTSRGKK